MAMAQPSDAMLCITVRTEVAFISSYHQSPPLQHARPKAWQLLAKAQAYSRDGNNTSGGGGDSYLSMWKRAKDREEQEKLRLYRDEMEKKQQRPSVSEELAEKRDWEEKAQRFATILQVPAEERDRVQRMQMVDRAAAALAAVNALLAEQSTFRNSAATLPPSYARSVSEFKSSPASGDQPEEETSTRQLTLGAHATPGPDFWTWSPPSTDVQINEAPKESTQRLKSDVSPGKPAPALLKKEAFASSLAIPFESMENEELSSVFQSRAKPSLPPLQSLLEVQNDAAKPSAEATTVAASVSIPDIGEDIASFIQQDNMSDANMTHGVNLDGSRWWKETGKELHKDGVTCMWTVIRGTNADGTEWEEKFWEAFDDLDYKELGAEKSGRDAAGNVWREFWKEALWQDLSTGLLHIDKTADKWAKNGQAGEWHEKWWEHYNASGHAEKWADKWCKVDEATPLEPGHAHVWHERWGEKFDGQGGAIKYTDKWAERKEYGGMWSKWGDKWDENFNKFGHGVKQGETWWEGVSGERWNRTWGEKHSGTGWVQKYGKSSSGEHWDTHEQQDTWYEREPHFGFHNCLENSGELRRVGSKRNSKL